MKALPRLKLNDRLVLFKLYVRIDDYKNRREAKNDLHSCVSGGGSASSGLFFSDLAH
jgi:hypothetical protein